ncbi:MAG: N-acetyl-gamma-glutamyl-phosphate reductase [Defluviitaleaceae bacterium]|nr:N-acetyl-gamma-glutamyl-phosphate reductase [Defluviitaleaceae bacterium]
MLNIFIDGQAGTTGLKLEERLKPRKDITLLTIDPAMRKDPSARQSLMEKADVIFLCLPDDEARKAVEMAPAGTLVIDASTAHRTNPDWVYGLPELSPNHRSALAASKRIAVPGCHAAGFISMMYPLLEGGIISRGAKLHCNSLTGYSGGGRGLIEVHENSRAPGDNLHAPRPYALGLGHKHLPEMQGVCGLSHPPHFMPVVGDIAQGMFVTVPLWVDALQKPVTIDGIYKIWAAHYEGSSFINVMPPEPENNGFIDITPCNGSNRLDLFVFGHETQILLGARLDNLGKGASGAAVQCMNIACGMDEKLGL